MADGGLYLLDVTVRPGGHIKDVIDGSWASLQDGSKKGGGKVIHGFKVRSLGYLRWAVHEKFTTLTCPDPNVGYKLK